MAGQMMQETAGKVIPTGYKQTEVGVIPEDWDVCLLKNICSSFKTGKLDAKEGANKSYGTRAFTGNPLILND
ncbi:MULTISPECIES: hypothetical protein [unclassified Aeromonas]|uniref:hypothetical protein n=1 Tax=unclassified Aeromonas TaxID=257493 RepID=UPI0022E0A1C8|nr:MULTISPECIES: hypothetical protein [unclassified Aeromonas]